MINKNESEDELLKDELEEISKEAKELIESLPERYKNKLLAGNFTNKFGLGGLKSICDKLERSKDLKKFQKSEEGKKLEKLCEELDRKYK